MSHALRISEAATLALHAMAVLTGKPEQPLSTHDVAAELHVSEAHLAKVFQRLARAGLAKSSRGPGGGFVLGKPATDISLLDIYETIDGPIATDDCLLGEPTCTGEACLLGDLVKSVNEQMRSYLTATRLADVATTYRTKAAAR
jgi:Rrf2 family protein